MKTATQNNTNN